MNEKENNIIEHIKKSLLPFFKMSKTKKAYLFGSFAEGTMTRKSDVDLMIITDTDKRFFDRYNDYDQIQQILSDRSIEMLIYTPEELNSIAHRAFIRRILTDGQVIYEC